VNYCLAKIRSNHVSPHGSLLERTLAQGWTGLHTGGSIY